MDRNYESVKADLDRFVGVPFGEIADELNVSGLDLPARSRKSFAGDMTEAMLAIAKNSIPGPDLDDLGWEVKSIPVGRGRRPREDTKVTSLPLRTLSSEASFYGSRVYAKLRAVLFMPIQKNDLDEPRYWYLLRPFLWHPNREQLSVIEDDYLTYVSAYESGNWERLTSRTGRYLAINTSGDTSAGRPREDRPYAWWLKRTLTQEILRQHIG